MSSPAIRVDGIGKRYRLGEHTSFGSLRESLMNRLRSFGRRGSEGRPASLWALRDVSFEVARGEAIGIIGPNGAGKSTLLKVLSRITEPTEGSATIHGRVGSLLEVGTGFHPELTGRENIFLNGAILGMTREETRRQFDDIVAFAEVERFLDTPVKRYSSGMYLRLAFAVAAHLEPEILLVDEVLAVGDAAFQKKCLGKMSDVAQQGRTVLFVSHNMSAISSLCQRALWIEQGSIREDGDATAVVGDYLSQGHTAGAQAAVIPAHRHRHEPKGIRFDSLEILDPSGEPNNQLFFSDPLRFRIHMEATRGFDAVRLTVAVVRLDGTLALTLIHPEKNASRLLSVDPGRIVVDVDCTAPLMPGGYTVGLLVKRDPGYWGSGEASIDMVDHASVFHVNQIARDGSGPLPTGAVFSAESTWKIEHTAR
jgi:lipopolysaccharide transport system ATP-binding protein